MNKNVFFILLDGCEFSTFEDLNFAKKVAPNINSLLDRGVLKKIISNGMITQVSLPAILSQTYPLDFDGYNLGIKNRPKSIIEIIKDNNYKTAFIAAHDITGPRRNYERGAEFVKSIYDFDDTIEDYIRLILYHEIKKFDQKEINLNKIKKILEKEFHEILLYALEGRDRVNYFFMPRRLKKPNNITRKKILSEINLLKKDPLIILDKLKRIPSMFYKDYLGVDLKNIKKDKLEEQIKKKKKWHNVKVKFNSFFKKLTRLGLSPFPIYLSPVSSEIIREAKKFIETCNNIPWFIFMQLMDNHDGQKTSRYFNFIAKLRYIPFLYKIRKSSPTHRDFWRDLSLIYMDKEIGRLIKSLKIKKKFNNTIFYLFGDHGMGWDIKRNISNSQNLGFRTFFEHIEVPLIISPFSYKLSSRGVHDGMSISSTLIEHLNLKKHNSFKGKSIMSKGKKASIVESVGRGNCDFEIRDIYYTVTSLKFKVMFYLENNQLYPVMMFDKVCDPNEYDNLLLNSFNKKVIDEFANFLVDERKEFLLMRKVDIKSIISKKYKWTINLDSLKKSYKPPKQYS